MLKRATPAEIIRNETAETNRHANRVNKMSSILSFIHLLVAPFNTRGVI